MEDTLMAMRISAAVLRQVGGPIHIESLHLDDPEADEVLVRIVASGICQTDAHVRQGHVPAPTPIVLGHEGAGVVERVGIAVQSVSVGDHVVLSYHSCGRCESCSSDHPAYCDLAFPINFAGARVDGSNALRDAKGAVVHGHFFGQSSFSNYALANLRNVVKVPRDLPLELLASLGCGVQTGASAVLRSLGVTRGSSFVVFGVGAVGMAALMAANIAAAKRVIAVDLNADRLALARELGASDTIRAGKPDQVAAEINRITGRGANFLLDTSGHRDSLNAGIMAMAPMGKFGGVAFSPGSDASLQASSLFVGKSLQGIIQGDAIPQLFIPEMIAQYRAARFPFDRLVRFYDFDQIEQAFADAALGVAIKPVLRISPGGRA